MRRSLRFLPLLLAIPARSQDIVVQNVLNALSIDSMMHYVEELSGEVPVELGEGPITIQTRHKLDIGNSQAQTYLEQKLAGWGYSVEAEEFSATGRNVLASRVGVVHPDEMVILCAHYDSYVSSPFLAPAADDDGSGCGALLEAARLLRNIPFEYTIVLAFWDEEEQGKVGSLYHANQMAGNDALIRGVINMDAIAYDGNADRKARVHARSVANSMAISDTVFAVLDRYDIDIDLLLTTPGAIYSDHASFWTNQYGAVLIIEEFGADGNPMYHTPNDRVEFFDVPYFEKLAKLSIGSFATLAIPHDVTAGTPVGSLTGPSISVHPNPATTHTTLTVELDEPWTCTITFLDALGQPVAGASTRRLSAGVNRIYLETGALAAGNYTVVITGADGRMLRQRLVHAR